MKNELTLEEKIELVKNDILSRFPDCHYTICIILWDDNTDLVECRHGRENELHISQYYKDELTYVVERDSINAMMVDSRGVEYYPKRRK